MIGKMAQPADTMIGRVGLLLIGDEGKDSGPKPF